jgi:hypothetical protein
VRVYTQTAILQERWNPMIRKLAFACLLSCVAGTAHAKDRLATLIPNLFGPNGLVVDSEARLPDGSTHSAHFNSAFQAEFTQFNISLASQITSVPLPSPASGFTYTFDPALGVFNRSSRSYGPILSDRAETIGKHKVALGTSYQRFTFDTIEGVDLGDVPAVFTHDDANLGGGRIDVVTTSNAIELEVAQFTTFLNAGLSDSFDLAVAVPFLNVKLSAMSRASVQRLGTQTSPATHFFRDANGNLGTEKLFTSSGEAQGVGDVLVRAKWRAVHSGNLGIALGVDGRLATGDEENLLGSGAPGVKPFMALSVSNKVLSPHVNVGYQWNGDSVLAGDVLHGTKGNLPDQILWEAGVDVGVSDRLTVAFDLIGRRVLDSPRLVSETFDALDGHSTFPDIHFESGQAFNIINAAGGFKWNPVGRLLIDANVLVKLDNGGLRDKLTPLVGLEYGF